MTTPVNDQSKTTAVVPGEGTTPNLDTPTLTITRYQQLAEEFMAGLDTLVATIPKFELKHSSTANFVKGHQSIPNAFLASSIAAVEQSSDLKGLRKLDVPTSRDALQFIEAFRAVSDKVNAFGASLDFTLRSRKAALAVSALQIYEIAKGVARDAGGASLAAHVENMKRDLKRGRPASKLPPEVRKAANAAAAEAFKATVIAATEALNRKPSSPADPVQKDFKAGRDL
jgi:hypothetical protein